MAPVLVLAACAAQSPAALSHNEGGTGGDAALPGDASTSDAAADAPEGSRLTLSLDPSLDQSSDEVKVQAISSAVLLDETGATLKTATVDKGTAVFDLTSLKAGDYFVAINGDMKDLVPTRIDGPGGAIAQRVGAKLRTSYIGPPDSPTYRVNTYSAGQSESPVAKYSDGTVIAGEQPYVIYTFATSLLEVRLLGTAAALTSLPLPRCVGHPDVPADGWLLNTTNENHHGDAFNADGGSANCQTCHWFGSMKKYAFSVISPTDGWCYRCHYGPTGSGAGFVDPTQ